jgi:hypothetical protein
MTDLQHANQIQPLSRNAYYALMHTLTSGLPLPVPNTPQALLDRNHAAIDKVAAMLPVNQHEADFAARCVAAGAQADEVMRQIREYDGDLKTAMKLNAQYVALVRTSLSAHGHLLRAQGARHKRESLPAAADADAWTLHIATSDMRKALDPRAELPISAPSEAQPPAPAASSAPQPAPAAAPSQPSGDPITPNIGEPLHGLAAEAEYYANIHPRRARSIRQHGGLPPNCDFGPPEDELVRAIVTGTSPALRALDAVGVT